MSSRDMTSVCDKIENIRRKLVDFLTQNMFF